MRKGTKARFSGRTMDVELTGDLPTNQLSIVVYADSDDSEEQLERIDEALAMIRSWPRYIGGLLADARALDRDLVTLRRVVGRAVRRLGELEKKAREDAAATVEEWPSPYWDEGDLAAPDDADLEALDRIYRAVHSLAAPRKCRHCGKEFVGVEGGREQRYCSLRCRVAAFRLRQKSAEGERGGAAGSGKEGGGAKPSGAS